MLAEKRLEIAEDISNIPEVIGETATFNGAVELEKYEWFNQVKYQMSDIDLEKYFNEIISSELFWANADLKGVPIMSEEATNYYLRTVRGKVYFFESVLKIIAKYRMISRRGY